MRTEHLIQGSASFGGWTVDSGPQDWNEEHVGQQIADTQSENWMINKAVHYNQWANLHPKEFAVVAAAFQAFLKSMQCAEESCSEFLHVSPVKGDKETLRCGCGSTMPNLTISKGKV